MRSMTAGSGPRRVPGRRSRREGYVDDKSRTLRVATKYGNIARDYYASINRDIEIIPLHGSIELAPLCGLSDVIVDIVETGTTLRENKLVVLRDIMPISARFIANKTSYRFRHDTISAMANALKEVLP